MRRFIGRENVRKRLAPLEGSPGTTVYADGAVRIESETENLVARPPFGLAHEGEYDRVHVEPLLAAIAEDHVVAALLVRLGGYAAGVFEGERLIASKVGTRFVKNRHKKGGSSANRFRRRREEQARVLVDAAAPASSRSAATAPPSTPCSRPGPTWPGWPTARSSASSPSRSRACASSSGSHTTSTRSSS